MGTDRTTKMKGTGKYADVNGINLYYEIHGAGRPPVLLHGGLGSGEMFGPILPHILVCTVRTTYKCLRSVALAD
jgi:pimeloyl-ACP methyl ester carboxylesterase